MVKGNSPSLGSKGNGSQTTQDLEGVNRSFSRFKEEGASYVDRDMIQSHS